MYLPPHPPGREPIRRGSLCFFLDTARSVISVYEGNPYEIGHEAEFVTTLHESSIPDLIAGLTAARQQLHR